MASLMIRGVQALPNRVCPGGQVTILFEVVDPTTGTLTASTGSVQISSGDRTIQQAWAAVTVIIAGRYSYTFEVTTAMPVGWWTVEVKTASGEAQETYPDLFEVR